jgi:hypothetical protein
VLDFVPLQKSQVFLRKAPLGMMVLLIANIINYAAELRMAGLENNWNRLSGFLAAPCREIFPARNSHLAAKRGYSGKG